MSIWGHVTWKSWNFCKILRNCSCRCQNLQLLLRELNDAVTGGQRMMGEESWLLDTCTTFLRWLPLPLPGDKMRFNDLKQAKVHWNRIVVIFQTTPKPFLFYLDKALNWNVIKEREQLYQFDESYHHAIPKFRVLFNLIACD